MAMMYAVLARLVYEVVLGSGSMFGTLLAKPRAKHPPDDRVTYLDRELLQLER